MVTLIAFMLGLLLLTLAAIFWEKLLFSRLLDDPLVGKALSVVAAWLTCGLAVDLLFGAGSLGWRPFVLWLIPGAPVALWFLYRGYRLRQDHVDAATVAKPFEIAAATLSLSRFILGIV